MNKVKEGTEKYPNKRGYAIGELQVFLKEKGLTEAFTNNCKLQNSERANRDIIHAFTWSKTQEGFYYWESITKEFLDWKEA